MLIFLAWIARRGAGRPGLFSAAFGMALLLFVTAGKQAWMNYYFLIGQSLLLGAATIWPTATADNAPILRKTPE
jgi:hypothetical protein